MTQHFLQIRALLICVALTGVHPQDQSQYVGPQNGGFVPISVPATPPTPTSQTFEVDNNNFSGSQARFKFIQ